ncbi:MAG TPA: hypothetical protein VGG28_28125 [Kofleriaceae bacterium]|jgi:hypothetical protein
MADVWTVDAPRITDPAMLSRLASVLENESALIVEHKFYRGSRAPHRFVIDDYDELVDYLRTQARPGDSFWIWHFEQCCRDDNVLAAGKSPDADGKVPLGGAY